MPQRDLFLLVVTLGLELTLCFLVYARGTQRRMPFFALYATVLALGTVAFVPVYAHFGFRSSTLYYADWITAGVDVLARSLVIVELCRYGLRAYQGIWAITWRLLAILTLLFFAHASIDAWGQPKWFATYALTVDRDIEITSIFILVALLGIRNYYGLSLGFLQKWIAAGICLFCVVDVVNSTVWRNFLASYLEFWSKIHFKVEQMNEMWNTIHFSTFIACLGIWCYAVWKALPEPAEDPVLLPAEVYRELSPAINERLQAFNQRLLEMLKPKMT